ncbi:transmembrane protein 255B [Gastrophryne carolinensis]
MLEVLFSIREIKSTTIKIGWGQECTAHHKETDDAAAPYAGTVFITTLYAMHYYECHKALIGLEPMQVARSSRQNVTSWTACLIYWRMICAHFAKRKRTSLCFTIALLTVALLILIIGLTATTRTENITVGGYYPGIILGFGSFLGIIGIHLVENRKQMLVASIVFISFGVVASFCCAIVDGVFAARHIEPRPLYTGRCNFYASGSGLAYDTQQTVVTCSTSSSLCQLRVRTHTCYCCDLYNCESPEQSGSYYEFVGVNSCQDVLHLYRLLWTCTVLNIVGLFLGSVTAAFLGAFKDMSPISQLNFSTPPPQILYNPAQQILTYTGFCSSTSSLPSYASYPLPLQPSGSNPATSSADISLSDDIQYPSHSNSMNGLPSNPHSQFASTMVLTVEKPPPYAP